MPSLLVTTPGSVSANAYCSIAEADAYHDDLPLAAVRVIWTAATTDDKTRAILTATRLIDRTFAFVGARVTDTQALEWPRYAYPLFRGTGTGPIESYQRVTSFYIDPTTIPDRLKDATAEYARQLLVSDRTADPSSGSSTGIKKIKADVVEIEYRDDAVSTAKPVPDAVAVLLAGLGTLSGATQVMVPLVRV
jgi:hypothetical protein